MANALQIGVRMPARSVQYEPPSRPSASDAAPRADRERPVRTVEDGPDHLLAVDRQAKCRRVRPQIDAEPARNDEQPADQSLSIPQLQRAAVPD